MTRGHLRAFLGAAVALALAAALSCAVPAGTGYAPRSAEEAFVVQTISAMAEALNAGDVARFMARVSGGYYRGTAPLEKRLGAGLANRVGFRIEVAVLDMAVEESRVTARVSWKAAWRKREGGEVQSLAGENNLVFMRGTGIKLIDQREEVLFGF